MGELRIIGGKHRGRKLRFPDTPGLRPTPDRVRETLFNWLGQRLDGMRCLDLFAGSGALGFEAASRGAASVTLVESDLAAHAQLASHATVFAPADIRVVRMDALVFLARREQRYDAVFLDPPYASGLLMPVLQALTDSLNPDARVYVEHDGGFALPEGWVAHKQLRAGQVHGLLIGRD
jgi:16S rRNA (guanine966-N2)-methyltransferase